MKNIIKKIIIDFQEDFKIDLIKRDLEVFDNDEINKAISIYGPRRSGKTSYLFLKIKELISKEPGRIQDIIYINFEDNKLSELNSNNLDLITESYNELFPEKKPYLFLDEIQNIQNWSKWVRKLIDKKYKIFITGSNSKYLSKEIATELRGRTLSYLLLPYSLKEYLRIKGFNFADNDIFNTKKKNYFVKHSKDYLNYGGFPETANLNAFERKLILNEYFNTIVHKDLIERYDIKNVTSLKFIINYLLDNYSNVITVNKIYNTLKSLNIKSGKDTIYDYFRYLEESLFSFSVNKYSESLKEKEGYGKKHYVVDNGYLMLGKQHLNTGRAFENLIFLELLRMGYEIYFTSNGFECDFILKKEKNIFPVQVSYSLKKSNQTFEREVKSLLLTLEMLNIKKGYIITMDESETITKEGKEIKIISLFEFFLFGL